MADNRNLKKNKKNSRKYSGCQNKLWQFNEKAHSWPQRLLKFYFIFKFKGVGSRYLKKITIATCSQ